MGMAGFMMRSRSFLDALSVAAPLIIACAACGTDAKGVDDCKRIEEARCTRAPSCGVRLEPPYWTSGTASDACIRFYDVACLHGLEADPPKPTDVDHCVTAIMADCTAVVAPETHPACAWLAPAASPPPDASDAPVDAGGTDG